MNNTTDNLKQWWCASDSIISGSAAIIGVPEITTGIPVRYRLGRKPDGEIVLQGEIIYTKGWNEQRTEWVDIPIVDLEN